MIAHIKFWVLFVVANISGLVIGFIDSRPHWDDTGITVGLIVFVSACLGFIMPRRAWIWAITVGFWIFVWDLIMHYNFSSSIALPIAFIGAYLGVMMYKLVFSSSD
jgi:hypothetical protein